MRTEYRSIFEIFFKSYVPDYTNVISQNVAQQAFEHGDLLGEGAYGIVKFCYIDDKPVIVKEFNDDALEMGIPYSEYHAHHAFYKSLKNQCTEYFSKPLNVQINKKSRYTVQAPLHYKDETINTISKMETISYSVDQAAHLLFSIQSIINCMLETTISHGDIKSDNVLLISREYPVVRIIDFGCCYTREQNEDDILPLQFFNIINPYLNTENADTFDDALKLLKNDKFSDFIKEKLDTIKKNKRQRTNRKL